MKTVIDAVNQQQGVWSCLDSDSAYHCNNGALNSYWYYGEYSPLNNEHVCTRDDFEQCCTDLSGDPIKLQLWKDSKNMTNLTQQQIIELFKDAPDSVYRYCKMTKGNTGVYYWLSDTGYWIVGDTDYPDYYEFALECDSGENFRRNDFYTIHVKPVTPSLIYTQAMYKEGVVPLVGMDCLFKHNSRFTKGTVVAKTKRFIVMIDPEGMERVRLIDESRFKPLETISESEKAFDAHYGTLKPPFTKKDALNIWNMAIDWSKSE